MTLLQINEQFKTVTDAVAGLNGYSFGWPSDRARSQTYEDPGEDQTDLYPRVLFSKGWTMKQDKNKKNDIYQCQVFFDDLLGYDDNGEADDSTEAEKFSTLLQAATQWTAEMQNYRTSGHIEGDVDYYGDSFALQRRVITIVASFTFVTKTPC